MKDFTKRHLAIAAIHVATWCSIGVGYWIPKYLESVRSEASPSRIVSDDFNNDSLEDLVITSRDGKGEKVFLGRYPQNYELGSKVYSSLDEVLYLKNLANESELRSYENNVRKNAGGKNE